ncbi:MAG: metal ABC transporter substrate-binding protein [Schwartzia sp. (in: firmicutes)]
MKKFLSLFFVCLMTLALAGCGAPAPVKEEKSAKLRVVTTIFPLYDWTRAILGGESSHVELTMLLDKGVDLHSYQPTADDVLKISTCDVFIYVGGESDAWVKDALKTATNKNMVVLNLMEVLGSRAKVEETTEGMEAHHHHHDHDAAHEEEAHHHHHDAAHEEEAHRHDHDAVHEEHGHEHHHAPEYDEHIWLSLKNAQFLTDAIADALAKADAAHAETYRKNVAAYREKLASLDKAYQAAVDGATHKTLLFCDRFPFRYLADDYGLTYYAAFSGCSAETEASFETVAFLANKLAELKLPAVLTIEGKNHKIAETVIATAKMPTEKVLTLDSLQSTTAADVAKGATYVDAMKKNLDVLKQALR